MIRYVEDTEIPLHQKGKESVVALYTEFSRALNDLKLTEDEKTAEMIRVTSRLEGLDVETSENLLRDEISSIKTRIIAEQVRNDGEGGPKISDFIGGGIEK